MHCNNKIVMVYILTWIVSVLLYVYCPNEYDALYNVILFSLYMVAYVNIFKDSKPIYLNFSTVFLGVNIFIVYLFPLIFVALEETNLPFITFQEQYINKGTALCTLLSLSYIMGYSSYRAKIKSSIEVVSSYRAKRLLKKMLYLFSIVIFIYYIPKLGMSYASVANMKLESILSLVLCLFAVYLSYLCWVNRALIMDTYGFLTVLKQPLLLLMLLFLLYVILGIRSSALQLLLMPICLYSIYVKNINYRRVLFLGIVGLIGFSVISFTRTAFEYDLKEVYSLSSGFSIQTLLVLFNDFITNTKNIYLGLEYVDRYDYLYGQSFLLCPFSFAPYLPTLIAKFIFHKTPAEMSTQWILTDFAEIRYLGDQDSLIGTQCYIDLYMNMGLFLSIVILICLGRLVKYIHAHRNHNLYFSSIYVILFSYSVFMGRGSIADPLRLIIWVVVLIYIFIAKDRLVTLKS